MDGQRQCELGFYQLVLSQCELITMFQDGIVDAIKKGAVVRTEAYCELSEQVLTQGERYEMSVE